MTRLTASRFWAMIILGVGVITTIILGSIWSIQGREQAPTTCSIHFPDLAKRPHDYTSQEIVDEVEAAVLRNEMRLNAQ